MKLNNIANNPDKKWTKNMDRQYSKDAIKVNRHMKKCSEFLANREIQTKKHNGVLPHPGCNGCHLKLIHIYVIIDGENVKKKLPQFTVDGNCFSIATMDDK